MIDITTIGTLVAVIVSVAGVTWYFGRRLTRIESCLATLNPFFEYVERTFGILTGAMEKKGLITQEETKEIVKGVPFSKVWSTLKEVGANPIASKELQKLKAYVERIQEGDLLNMGEAKDFEYLSRLVAEEKKGDEGARWLLMLAGFLVGWWIGSSRE